jgi:rRNA-processing protein CGR1
MDIDTIPKKSQTEASKRKSGLSEKVSNKRSNKIIKGTSIPRGKPKSGRVWKLQKKRFTSIVADKPLHTSWNTKIKQRQEHKAMKLHEKQLKDAIQQREQDRKKRRAEKIKRQAENERKAEIVQKITNTAKLKRKTKKQMKSIRKA